MRKASVKVVIKNGGEYKTQKSTKKAILNKTEGQKSKSNKKHTSKGQKLKKPPDYTNKKGTKYEKRCLGRA